MSRAFQTTPTLAFLQIPVKNVRLYCLAKARWHVEAT